MNIVFCSKCTYWSPHENKGLSGNCRFNPPTVLRPTPPAEWPDTVWPVTGPSDWCGKGSMSVATPNHARDLAEALSDLLLCDDRPNRIAARQALDAAIAEVKCTCNIGKDLHADWCPVYLHGMETGIGFGQGSQDGEPPQAKPE